MKAYIYCVGTNGPCILRYSYIITLCFDIQVESILNTNIKSNNKYQIINQALSYIFRNKKHTTFL